LPGAGVMAGADPLLDVRGLRAAYGSAQVLHGVDLQVHAGEAVALLGRNGMGKTTVVRAVMGIVTPSGGDVHFAGESIGRAPAHRIARRGIALVPEGRQVFASLTVHEHLSAFVRRDARGATPWDAARVFSLFPRLAERRDQWAQQLSGGE